METQPSRSGYSLKISRAVPSRRGTQLNGNLGFSEGELNTLVVPSRRGTQLNGNVHFGANPEFKEMSPLAGEPN